MKRIFKILCFGAFLITLLIIGSFLLINISTYKYIDIDIEKVEDAQTAIVLGAGLLTNGRLSPIFRDRIDTAIALYQSKKGDMQKEIGGWRPPAPKKDSLSKAVN